MLLPDAFDLFLDLSEETLKPEALEAHLDLLRDRTCLLRPGVRLFLLPPRGVPVAARPGLARHYVYLLKQELDPDAAAAVEATSSDAGEMVVRGRAAHALLGPGYQDGTVDPLRATKLLGVATNRNLSVVTSLAERWC